MATFWDHLVELRFKLLLCVAAILLGAMVAHVYHGQLIALLLAPVRGSNLTFLSPLDPLLFILKIDVFAGVLLATPVISWSALSFLKPALAPSHWLLFSLVYCIMAFMTLAGLAYAYMVIVPLSLKFLMSINIDGIDHMVTATSYLNFFLTQSLITAAIFQIPLLVIAGSYVRAFSVRSLSRKRRHIYLVSLILLAVLTPTTDLFTLGIMLVPTLALFEGSLLAGRAVEALVSQASSARG